jgi:hypothetical protein
MRTLIWKQAVDNEIIDLLKGPKLVPKITELFFFPDDADISIKVDGKEVLPFCSLREFLTRDMGGLPISHEIYNRELVVIEEFLDANAVLFDIEESWSARYGMGIQYWANGSRRIQGPYLTGGDQHRLKSDRLIKYCIREHCSFYFNFETTEFSADRLMFYLFNGAQKQLESHSSLIGNYLFYDNQMLVPEGESESGPLYSHLLIDQVL